jgi:DNA polymerase III epsilon subunit-like protein
MKLLIFDTETTGLPKSRKASKEGSNNWPHMVSISWIILDSETNQIEKERSYIVQPRSWIIPEESIQIHGITQERAEREGDSLATILGEFLAENYDMLVAHNMEFDYNVLDNAIRWDLDMSFNEIKKPKICTMELGRDLCKLRTLFGKPKAPKLKELYEHAFGSPPDETQLHNSLYDTKVLTKVIQEYTPLRVKMNLVKGEQEVVRHYVHQKNGTRILSIRLDNTA